MEVRLACAAALVFLVGACAQINPAPDRGELSETQQAQAALLPPHLVEGNYMAIPMRNMWCPKCANFPGRWQANTEIDVYGAPRIDAPIVDRLSAEEWVNAVRYELHLPALRGVVRRAGDGLGVGDEVFSAVLCVEEDSCEGLMWHDGSLVERRADLGVSAPEIEYAVRASNPDFKIDWVYVEREGGRRSGWIRDMNLSGIE